MCSVEKLKQRTLRQSKITPLTLIFPSVTGVIFGLGQYVVCTTIRQLMNVQHSSKILQY